MSAQKSKNQRNPRRRGGRKGPSRRENMEVQAVYNAIVAKKAGGGKRPRRKRQGRGGGSQTKFQNRNVHRSTMKMSTQRGDVKHLPQFVEQVGQPLSSAAWALFKSYNVNPGLAVTFPIGSAECVNWQKYRFRKLEMVYEPLVNEFNTNNDGAGEVLISFNPDASDQPPSTFAQAINRKPIARGRPCDYICLTVPPSLLRTMNDAHFLRFGVPPGASDIKTYDIGLVDVSVVGCGTTGTTTLGNLFWRYELDVITQQQALTGAPANFSVSFFQSTAAQMFTTATPALSLNATASANGLGIVNTAGSFVPPAGNYIVSHTIRAGDSSAEAFKIQNDFQKNAVSVYTVGGPPQVNITAVTGVGAACVLECGGDVFVSANGTDAFTQLILLTGAAGTLTGSTTVLWTAV